MKARDLKDDPDHIPVEKRLSGDFGSPLELMATKDLEPAQKRAVLEVWLRDLEAQPASAETDALRNSIRQALGSLGDGAEREQRK